MNLREAAQQALAAMENIDREFRRYGRQHWPEAVKATAAITALKTALAEPTPLEDVVTHGSAWSKDGKRIDPMSVYAEPVQEPVAYIHRQGNHFEVSERHLDEDEKARGWTEEPLYAAPPQRKPLTDEEIEGINRDLSLLHMQAKRGSVAVVFARAIERAHGIGEQQ